MKRVVQLVTCTRFLHISPNCYLEEILLVCGIKTLRPPHSSALELICQHDYKASDANPTGRHGEGFAQRRTKLTRKEWMIAGARSKWRGAFEATRAEAHRERPAGLQLSGFVPTFSPVGFESWVQRGVLLSPPFFNDSKNTRFKKPHARPPKQKAKTNDNTTVWIRA